MRTILVGFLWLNLTLHQDALSLNGVRADSIGEEGIQEKAPIKRVRRGWLWNQFFLQEEYTGSDYQYIGKLQSDRDSGNGLVRYVLSGEGAGTIFVIDETNGDLHATRRLDREEKAFYILRATVINKLTGKTLEPETEFTVKLHDINDNEPQFSKEFYNGSVPERSDIGTSVICVTATDADDNMYGNSAKLVYSIKHGQPYFSVDPKTGVIRTSLGPGDMDREQREHYQVVIEAKDMAGQRGGLTGTTVVYITLTDVNDNTPHFTHSIYQFRIPELSNPGTEVGRIKATDRDIGTNADMYFTIISGDALDIFDIFTNKETQEGVITVSKILDYENKQSYVAEVQVQNTQTDPRFKSTYSKDMATIQIVVEDMDEPPVFDKHSYFIEIKEDAAVGVVMGWVSAMDPDEAQSPVKYSVDRRTDMDHLFNVHPENGTLFLLKNLDREETALHNISVIATEIYHPQQSSPVSVYINLLDVNDNAPTFATLYESFVCEKTKSGQRIQIISAVDADEPLMEHKFFFSLVLEETSNSNFSLQDNGDNTASVVTRRASYSRLQQNIHLVPIVITDGDYPMQSSTETLTVRVCTCNLEGNIELCNSNAQIGSPGMSTGAFIVILLCVIILLLIIFLSIKLTRQRKKEPLIVSKEHIRDNVLSYNDEGGGEEDTHAFDIGALYDQEAAAVMEKFAQQRHDIIPTDMLGYPMHFQHAPDAFDPLLSPVSLASHDKSICRFINERVEENDYNPITPPYDSLATYADEGAGSVAESLSSLDSVSSETEDYYGNLSNWGPRFKKLADMYKSENVMSS